MLDFGAQANSSVDDTPSFSFAPAESSFDSVTVAASFFASSIVATSLVSTRSLSRKSILFAPDLTAHKGAPVPVLFDSGRSPDPSI